MVDEMEMLREMRGEVPRRPDVSEAQRKIAEYAGRVRAPRVRLADGVPVRRARPAYGVRFALGLAAAVVLAAATAVVILRPGGGEPVTEPAPPSAAAVLERAALVAARSTAAEIRPDQWFYLKESQHMPGAGRSTFEIWDRMDGRRMALRHEGGRLKKGPVEKGPTNVRRTQQEVEAFPADPDALLRLFRDAPERTPLSICVPTCPPEIAQDMKAFGTIGWYLKYGPVIPPETAAAMFQALAKIPRVSVEEDTTDMEGRHGIGVGFDAGEHGRLSYVLDPGDYHYMGVKAERDGRSFGMSVLGSGIVDRAGDIP
jgi:hypothetical protein